MLSRVSADDSRRLTIEVKASRQSRLSGAFHVTRNEWNLAEAALNHTFHLWDTGGEIPRLAVLSVDQVAAHIPADRGEGGWESAVIPYNEFASEFRTQPILQQVLL